MTLSITPIYAALFALFFVALSLRVIRFRRSARISLGDGGDEELRRRTACMRTSPSMCRWPWS